MIKAKDLIKKEHKDVYVLSEEVYVNLDEACKQAAIKKVYESLRKKYILHHSIPKWDKACVDFLNCRSKKLATRLEREFLRGEEKIKPLNTREFITIIYLDYERKPLIKSVLEDIKGLINEFADCYMWLRGDVSLTNFEQVRESLHWQFDKDDLLKTFNKGIGEYFFKTVWEKYDDCEYHYEFELIDFKPLEIEDER